eukprot:scaffold3356_cov112-Isochrysis_galbana.AAC.14
MVAAVTAACQRERRARDALTASRLAASNSSDCSRACHGEGAELLADKLHKRQLGARKLIQQWVLEPAIRRLDSHERAAPRRLDELLQGLGAARKRASLGKQPMWRGRVGRYHGEVARARCHPARLRSHHMTNLGRRAFQQELGSQIQVAPRRDKSLLRFTPRAGRQAD